MAFGGLINFNGLEELIRGVVEGHKEMSAQMQRLETTVLTLVSKAELDERQQAMMDSLAAQERQLAQLEIAHKAEMPLLEELPQAQKELSDRMIELERKITTDVNNATFSLIGRVKALESDMKSKTSLAEMRKLASEVEERAKRSDFQSLRDQVIKVRDHTSERIDDIGERTFNMRREMDERIQELQAASELVNKNVSERTLKLEEQSREVSTFVVRAERAINSKASLEEMHTLQGSFMTQLQDCQSMLQSQMEAVRDRAESIHTEFRDVWKGLRSVALKKDLDVVSVRATREIEGALRDDACAEGRFPCG